MTEQRQVYRIYEAPTPELVRQLNLILSLLSDRLDQMEGLRGTPLFYTAPTSNETATEDSELPLLSQINADIDALEATHNADIATVTGNINTHKADYTNPHQVTDHQVNPGEWGKNEPEYTAAWESAYTAATPTVAPLGLQQESRHHQGQLESLLETLSTITQRYSYPWELLYSPGEQANGVLSSNAFGYREFLWHKITADSITLGAGTSAETVADLRTANDGNIYDLTEAAATPGQNLIIDFVNVVVFNWVRCLATYEGSATHAVEVQLYNWQTSAWDDFDSMQTSESNSGTIMTCHCFIVPNTAAYIGRGANDGDVRVRIYHPMLGNASHNSYIDEVALYE